MKFLRWFVYSVVVVVFIIPMNVIVTVSTDEDQYRQYKENTQDKISNRLKLWAHGEKIRNGVYRGSRTLVA